MAASRSTQRSNSRNPSLSRILVTKSMADLPIPAAFRCPISLDLMKDPVTLHTGITYDRQSIEAWLELGNLTCPVTNQALLDEDMVPNHSLRKMIQDWCVANRALGVERIPTPRIPATPAQVSEMLSHIALSARLRDKARCRELVGKIKNLARESERNRRCIVSGGAVRVLSACFGELAAEISYENSKVGALEEVLSALTAFFPLDQDSCRKLAFPKSLDAIVSILKSADLEGRLNAAMVLKELVASLPPERNDAIARADGVIEALVKLIEKPISPRATKAALVAAYYMVTASERAAARFVEMGIVSSLLERIVDAEKSTCEKALGVLDGVLSCGGGREVACDNALTVPVLVKKLFRVSDLATEFAVSALWRLCKNENKEGGGCAVEALRVGAFQKLLLLLQVGCGGATKEKASELLKILNRYRGSEECIETVDIKGLKRSF